MNHNEALVMFSTHITQTCPNCNAGPGVLCDTPGVWVHAERFDLLNRKVEVASFRSVEFTNITEAREVLDNLCDLIRRYRYVTVQDYYELVSIHAGFVDSQWVWYNLDQATIDRTSTDRYIIALPQPVSTVR